MAEKLAYSTETKEKKPKGRSSSPSPSGKKGEGPIKMRLETKGRGGKAVTVLFNLPYDKTEAKKLMKELQAMLACGGTYKDGVIEFRGDMRDRIEDIFAKKGLKVVRAGGGKS